MTFSRRRFLAISAAALALPAMPRMARAAPTAFWQGRALGAHAEIRLAGLTQDEAAPILAAAEAELARIDRLFSLYDTGSTLMRLNARGRLDAPPPEMLELLSLSRTIHAATEGAFDPSVQPLFALLAEHAARGSAASLDETEATRRAIGFGHVAFDAGAVRFARPGMALTLNGIAQGYATDRLARLLRQAGLRDVLVDAGEIAAMGDAPGQTGWTVRHPGGRHVLRDAAIATSAMTGTMIDPARGIGHILAPRPSGQLPAAGPVTAIHDSAAMADAASTAAVLLGPDRVAPLEKLGVVFHFG